MEQCKGCTHIKADVDRLDFKRCGRRGFIRAEDCVQAEGRNFKRFLISLNEKRLGEVCRSSMLENERYEKAKKKYNKNIKIITRAKHCKDSLENYRGRKR